MSVKIGYLILFALVPTLDYVSIAVAEEVTIMDRAKVGNGAVLEGGAYEVEVVKNQDSSEVRFYKGGDLWLRAAVTVTPETKKAQHTEIYYKELDGRMVITKIRLRGSKEGLVFEPDTPKAE